MTKVAVTSLVDPLRKIRGVESLSEILFHNATLAILVFLFILLASKPLFGTPIVCQVPADWPESSVSYYADLCYYGRRENVAFKERLNRGNKRGAMTLNTMTGTSDAYMWIPFIPVLHLVLCLLPTFFWKFVGLDCFNGLDIIAFMEYFKKEEDGDELVDAEDWRIQKLAAQLHEWIATKRDSIFGLSRTLFLYVMMKWFRFSIFVLQFYLIAYFFGQGDLAWGYKSVIDVAQGRTINKLAGEFTLVAGCKVQKFTMGIDPSRHYSFNTYSSNAVCMLSANFINAKAFLFLYWWFLFVSVISFCSAVHHTFILLIPAYRKYEISSMIRNDNYYIERYGEPHKDLHLATANPTDHLIDYLGNDGFLVVRMVYDMLDHYAGDRFVEHVWVHEISRTGKSIIMEVCDKRQEKNDINPVVPDTDIDGAGDRRHAGYDHAEKPLSSSEEPNDSVSCAKYSLSKESQPSLMLSESDEDPLISPALFNSMA